MTAKQPHSPQNYPLPLWGRVGVGAANKPRSDKTTAPSPTKRLPPPWGRVGVGAANTPRSNKTLKTPPSPFTYTLSAQVYVNNPIGCALAHRLPDPTTIAQTAAQLPPPPWDWNSSRAVRERVGVGAANKPRSGKTPKTTPSSFTYTLSAQVYVNSPIACALTHRHLPMPPATGRIP